MKMDNKQRLDLIKKTYPDALIEYNKIKFNINEIEIEYNIELKKFYINECYFGRIPHIMLDGSICLYGNIDILINEINEESSLNSLVSSYIPWLLNLPLELKLLEFLFEIEFYLKTLFGYKIEEKKINKDCIFKKIRIDTVEELWEKVEEMEIYSTYELYINNYEDYSIFLKKEIKSIAYERDNYKKARQRVTGKKCNNITGKTIFIGVGSVNSYIIKYLLANGLNDIVFVDHDKFKAENAFRYAFPYKGKKKIYAVKEFCRNLDKINLKFYNMEIKSDSTANILDGCQRVIVSVDNFISWINIAEFLEKNCTENVEIILAAINNFGENAKFIKTNVKNIKDAMHEFIFNSIIKERRELIGNGCGKSIAIYDEEILIKLSKEVVKSILNNENKEEIIYVEVKDDKN